MSNCLSLIPPHVLKSVQDKGQMTEAHLCFDSVSELSKFMPLAMEQNVKIVPGAPRPLPIKFNTQGLIAFVQLKESGIIEHWINDQVIQVHSATIADELNSYLASSQQWWPIAAPNSDFMVGDLIAGNDGGSLEHGFGGYRDLVLGLEVVLASGEVIRCGGKTVKNVSGYDLSKLFIGSRHYLGIISSAFLRLHAHPQLSATLIGQAREANNLFLAAQLLIKSGLPLSCLEIVSSVGLKLSDIGLNDFMDQRSYGHVFIQVHGYQEVIPEMIAAIKQITDPLLNTEVVNADCESKLWKYINGRTVAYDSKLVEVSLNNVQLKILLNELEKRGKELCWQLRPGKGRLKMFVSKTEESGELLVDIKEIARQNDLAMTIAFADDEFEYHCERLPNEDTIASALKLAIKNRFDPNHSLNPLVLP